MVIAFNPGTHSEVAVIIIKFYCNVLRLPYMLFKATLPGHGTILWRAA
jgi:hypothetical protein